ncbi:MAG: hypothetical protein J0L92_16375 [Deltaproteobacteria bacterium]|nr:hypothetical protein [Deltaproteobacteria bacterium]
MATRGLTPRHVAVALTLAMPSLAACEQRFLVCHCLSPGTPREQLEGTFVHTLDAFEVLDGEYAPPSLPPARRVRTTAGENFFLWTLEDGQPLVVLRINGWVDVRSAPGRSGECCGPVWDDLELADPQPPWSERNRLRVDTLHDLGDILVQLDPTLRYAEAAWSAEYDASLGIVGDAEGRELVFRADYWIQPEGCDDAACAATVRLTHRFRRE